MSDLVPITLPDDEHLKDDERWVRHLLEGTVGQTRVIDRRGGSEQGKHDLEVDLPDGGLPSAERPMPLTHLWLIAPTIPTRAFRWARSSGWSVVRFPPEQPQAA